MGKMGWHSHRQRGHSNLERNFATQSGSRNDEASHDGPTTGRRLHPDYTSRTDPTDARTGSMESSRPLLEGLNRTGDDTQKPPLSSGASIKGKGPSSSDKAPGP